MVGIIKGIALLYVCGMNAYMLCVILGCIADDTKTQYEKLKIVAKATLCAPIWFVLVAWIRLKRRKEDAE